MAPYLDGGEVVTLAPAQAEDLRAGDLVAVRGAGTDAIIIHRVLKRERRADGLWLHTKGDGNARFDEPVPEDRVLARVTRIERRGEKISSTEGVGWRVSQWARAMWLRAMHRLD